jgi:predicted MFS family arabinose efflux permease
MLFPASQAGWRIASQYLFAAMGMALGGWIGGAMYDASGSYTDAFLVGFLLNLVNLLVMGTLAGRYRRMMPRFAAA